MAGLLQSHYDAAPGTPPLGGHQAQLLLLPALYQTPPATPLTRSTAPPSSASASPHELPGANAAAASVEPNAPSLPDTPHSSGPAGRVRHKDRGMNNHDGPAPDDYMAVLMGYGEEDDEDPDAAARSDSPTPQRRARAGRLGDGDATLEWPCTAADVFGCRQRFAAKSTASVHTIDAHRTGSYYKCPHCYKPFKRLPLLKRHVQDDHQPDDDREVAAEAGPARDEPLPDANINWTKAEVAFLASVVGNYPEYSNNRWQDLYADHGPAGRVTDKLRTKTLAQIRAKSYKECSDKHRRWTPAETRCLRLAMTRHAPGMRERYRRIYEEHGPGGSIDEALSRKTLTQIRDKGDKTD